MSSDLHRTWGRAIRAAREDKAWSQTALAERLGVRPSSVCRWESGSTAPSDGNKLRIAVALEVDVRVLFQLISTA